MDSRPDLHSFYFCPYCHQNYPKTDLNCECTRVLFLTPAVDHIQICWRCNNPIPTYHICDCIVIAIKETREVASRAEYYFCETCSEHVAIDQRERHGHDTWALRSTLALRPAEVQIALVPEQMSASVPHPSSLAHIHDSVDDLPSVPSLPPREAKTPPPSFPNNTDGPQMESPAAVFNPNNEYLDGPMFPLEPETPIPVSAHIGRILEPKPAKRARNAKMVHPWNHRNP